MSAILDRRGFLRLSVLAGGGWVMANSLKSDGAAADDAGEVSGASDWKWPRWGGAAVVLEAVYQAPARLVWDQDGDIREDRPRVGSRHFLRAGVDAAGRLCGWEYHRSAGAVPGGGGQALRDSASAWAIGSFLDELARAAARDPVDFNLDLLSVPGAFPAAAGQPGRPPPDDGRMRRVIELAAERSGWAGPLPRGRGRGLGYGFGPRGPVAEVAEVTVAPGGRLTIDRVVAVGGRGGRDRGGEFSVRRVPANAAAVSNAIFAATGRRIRQLPLGRADLSWS